MKRDAAPEAVRSRPLALGPLRRQEGPGLPRPVHPASRPHRGPAHPARHRGHRLRHGPGRSSSARGTSSRPSGPACPSRASSPRTVFGPKPARRRRGGRSPAHRRRPVDGGGPDDRRQPPSRPGQARPPPARSGPGRERLPARARPKGPARGAARPPARRERPGRRDPRHAQGRRPLARHPTGRGGFPAKDAEPLRDPHPDHRHHGVREHPADAGTEPPDRPHQTSISPRSRPWTSR